MLLAGHLMPPGPRVASTVCGLVVARALSSTGLGLSVAQFGIMILMEGNQVQTGTTVSRLVPCEAVTSLLELHLLSCPWRSLA